MATPTEPATSAIFRALRSVDVDSDLAYEAAEESQRQAGENIIAQSASDRWMRRSWQSTLFLETNWPRSCPRSSRRPLQNGSFVQAAPTGPQFPPFLLEQPSLRSAQGAL